MNLLKKRKFDQIDSLCSIQRWPYWLKPRYRTPERGFNNDNISRTYSSSSILIGKKRQRPDDPFMRLPKAKPSIPRWIRKDYLINHIILRMQFNAWLHAEESLLFRLSKHINSVIYLDTYHVVRPSSDFRDQGG